MQNRVVLYVHHSHFHHLSLPQFVCISEEQVTQKLGVNRRKIRLTPVNRQKVGIFSARLEIENLFNSKSKKFFTNWMKKFCDFQIPNK